MLKLVSFQFPSSHELDIQRRESVRQVRATSGEEQGLEGCTWPWSLRNDRVPGHSGIAACVAGVWVCTLLVAFLRL